MLDVLLGEAQSVRRGQVGCIDVEQRLHRGQCAVVHQALGNIVVNLQRSTQQQVRLNDSACARVGKRAGARVREKRWWAAEHGRQVAWQQWWAAGPRMQLPQGGRQSGASGGQLSQGGS